MIEVRVKRWPQGMVGEVISAGEESKNLFAITLQTHGYDFELKSIEDQLFLALANRDGTSPDVASKEYTTKIVPWEENDVNLWLTVKDILKIHLMDKEPDLQPVERIVRFYWNSFYTSNEVSGAPREVIRLYEYDKALAK